ncbi:MAG: hypothetical protein V4633_17540 [Pseudomonadota bacterium]
MMRSTLFRVMLSLLLLVSQQMATAHALSHLTRSDQAGQVQAGQVQDQDDLSSSFAQDQTCNQCLAFAQLALPIGCTHRAFAAPELVSMAVASAEAHSAIARTRLAFRSRAPPQA